MEVDSGQRREFEGKLAEAMQQLRQDSESQLQQYKGRVFSSKLHSAEKDAMEKKQVALATKEELETTTVRVETLSS